MLGSAKTFSINPSHHVYLGGYAYRKQKIFPFEGNLEANLLFLNSDKDKIVLVSLDLLYVGETLRKQVMSGISHLLREDQVFLAASHTHTAPMTDLDKPELGGPNLEYINWLASILIQEITTLLSETKIKLKLEYCKGKHNYAINRRRKISAFTFLSKNLFLTKIAPNPEGYFDSALHKIEIYTEDHELFSVVWSAAIHPTASSKHKKLSADFPGEIRNNYRSLAASNIPILFFQGFSGDVRPFFNGKKTFFTFLQIKTYKFFPFSKRKFKLFGQLISAQLALAPKTDTCIDSIVTKRISFKPKGFLKGERLPEIGFVHCIDLGGVALLGFPFEVCSRYIMQMSNRQKIILPISCVDNVFSYIPTKDMIPNKGYEVTGFCQYFGVESVHDDVEDKFLSLIENCINELNY